MAALQKQLATREQLLAAGLGRGAIAHRLRNGRLRERYRGVYLVDAGAFVPLADEMAAVLTYGGYGILSHWSAAVIWGLLEPHPGDIHLTLVGKRRVARPGIRVHWVSRLDRRDLRRREGLPLTSPPRTIVDLAAEASDANLEEAIAVAGQRGLASPQEIEAALERVPYHKGATRLRRLLQAGTASGFTRSEGERRMRALLRAAELPQPRANVPMLGYVADFLWPEQRLIVEVDGYLFHSSRSSFEHDRRRDQRFVAAGYVVIRITLRQLEREPLAVIARIAQALGARTA